MVTSHNATPFEDRVTTLVRAIEDARIAAERVVRHAPPEERLRALDIERLIIVAHNLADAMLARVVQP